MNAFHTPNPNTLELPRDIEQLTVMLRAAQQRLQQAEARILQLQTALDQAVAQKHALDQALAAQRIRSQAQDDPHSLSLSLLQDELHPLALLQEDPRPSALSAQPKDALSLSWDLGAELDGFFRQPDEITQPNPTHTASPIFPGDQYAFSPEKRAHFAALSSQNKSALPPFAEAAPQPLVSSRSHNLQHLSEETIESSLRELASELKKSPTPVPESHKTADPMSTYCDPDAAVKHFDQLQALRAVFAHKQASESFFSANKAPSQGDLHTTTKTPSQGDLRSVAPEHVETSSSPFEPMPRRILPVEQTVDATFQDLLHLLRR